MELAGKVAVVTGSGGRGSGRAEACRLAREGCRVVVSDVKLEGGAQTVRTIADAGGVARFFACDVAARDQVRALIAFAEAEFDGLDILVNNACARYQPGAPMAEWHATVQTDLAGVMYGVEFAIEAMRRRGGGAIVNVSSTSALGFRAMGWQSAACDIAKAGVLRLTASLAGLRDEAGIRVNCLVPDWVAHPEVVRFFEAMTPEERALPGVPPRLTTLEEVAHAALRLIADDSLAGRALVVWSGGECGLVSRGDRGYEALEPYAL